MFGVALLCTLTVQQAPKPKPITAADSTQIRRVAVARAYNVPLSRADEPWPGFGGSVVDIYPRRGDTVFVYVGTRVSGTQIRVERRDSTWVAIKDSTEVRVIR